MHLFSPRFHPDRGTEKRHDTRGTVERSTGKTGHDPGYQTWRYVRLINNKTINNKILESNWLSAIRINLYLLSILNENLNARRVHNNSCRLQCKPNPLCTTCNTDLALVQC